MKCPKCLASLELFMGGQFGQYHCKACGYIGPIGLEEEKKQ